MVRKPLFSNKVISHKFVQVSLRMCVNTQIQWEPRLWSRSNLRDIRRQTGEL